MKKLVYLAPATLAVASGHALYTVKLGAYKPGSHLVTSLKAGDRGEVGRLEVAW